MTYPKITLTKTKRMFFLVFLVLLFLITAPILIMYSIGYRLDIENKKIVETGVISIDIRPKDADVYLSGVKINKKIPIRLTNRAPGTYSLKIEKAGYKTWEKNIDVKSKQTTYIKDVNLIKDSLPISIFLDKEKKIKEYYPSSDGSYIILVSEEKNTDLFELFNTQTKEIDLIDRIPVGYDRHIEWSPFDNFILITKNRGSTVSLTLLSADLPEKTKVHTIRRDENNFYQWQKKSLAPTIYTAEKNSIVKFTTIDYKELYKYNDSETWYIDSDEKLWTKKGNIIKLESSDEEQKIIITENENFERIIDINENHAILKNENKIFVISRKEDEKSQTINANYFIFNPSTKEWLVWSPWELWSIYEHNKPALLNRTSDKILSVFPLDKVGELLVVSEGNGLTAFNPGYYVSQGLYKGEIRGASVNQKTKTINFFGKVAEKEGLFELEY
jgi:hypothetical protein